MIYIIFLNIFILTSSKRDIYEKDKMYIQINDEDDVFTIDLIKSPESEILLNALPLSTYLLEDNNYIKRMPISSIDIESNCLRSLTSINLNAKKGDILLSKGKEIILVNEDQVFDGEYIKIGHSKQMDEFSKKLKKVKNFDKFTLINSIGFEEHENRLRRENIYYINFILLLLIIEKISLIYLIISKNFIILNNY